MLFIQKGDIRLKHNVPTVIKFIESSARQISFASSNALNKTADIGMKAVENQLASNFDITSSWYKIGNTFGPRTKKSTKENLEVIIGIARGGNTKAFDSNIGAFGDKEHWIYDHEGGDIRTPETANDILIPTKQLLSRIGSAKGKTGRAKVNALMGAKNTRFERMIRGDKYIFARSNKKIDGKRSLTTPTGKVSKRKAKVFARPTMLFLVKNKVKIKDKFDFYEPIMKAFDSDFQKEFSKAFKEALRTMKV